jgi:hypothetical protein
MHTHLPRKQQGSFYSTVIIMVMFGIFLTASLKIAPTYMDNNVIQNAMEGIAANNDMAQMSLADIRSNLMRTLNTNSVTLDANNVQVVTVSGKEYIDINYEAKVPLFYNISAIVSFQNRFDKN